MRLSRAAPRGGAVVFVQRFTGTLSCFPHFHVLVLDGGYVADAEVDDDETPPRFVADSGPSSSELRQLEARILERRLAWLAPPPRRHQLRYAGVLAPASRLRPRVVPVGRVAVQVTWVGPRKCEPLPPVSYRVAWARLLARVYDVDGQVCEACGGRLRPVGAVQVTWMGARKCEPLAPVPYRVAWAKLCPKARSRERDCRAYQELGLIEAEVVTVTGAGVRRRRTSV